jgi:hypothetical protein
MIASTAQIAPLVPGRPRRPSRQLASGCLTRAFGKQLAQVSCDPAVIACERGDIPKSSKQRSQPRLRRVAPQRDQFSGFLPWIEAEPRERGEDRHDISVPVLADRRIEKSLELGRVRVEDIGCRPSSFHSLVAGTQIAPVSPRIRAGRSWRPYTGQCRRRSQASSQPVRCPGLTCVSASRTIPSTRREIVRLVRPDSKGPSTVMSDGSANIAETRDEHAVDQIDGDVFEPVHPVGIPGRTYPPATTKFSSRRSFSRG